MTELTISPWNYKILVVVLFRGSRQNPKLARLFEDIVETAKDSVCFHSVLDYGEEVINLACLRSLFLSLKSKISDAVFITLDRSYFVVPRLIRLAANLKKNEILAVGKKPVLSEGVLLSRQAMDKIALPGSAVSTDTVHLSEQEQLIEMGISLQTLPELGSGSFLIPTAENSIAVCPNLTYDELAAVHESFRSEPDGRIETELAGERMTCLLHEQGVFRDPSGVEFGRWGIDDEANLILSFMGMRSQTEYLSATDALDTSSVKRLRIGVMIIATGQYRSFLYPLFLSVRNFFLTWHDVHIYVFSDARSISDSDVTWIPVEHEDWPGMALRQYELIYQHRENYQDCDYLFFLDADMKLVAPVGEEILAKGLTAVLHPWHLSGPKPYEDDMRSTAFVPECEGINYYCGAVQGGKTSAYLEAAELIAKRIEADTRLGVVAKWHDESHWNRYLVENPPAKIMSPSYCFPEPGGIEGPPKILALDKNHQKVRTAAALWPKEIIVGTNNGLGNQMFQFANGLALARRLGAGLKIRYTSSGRSYGLGQFGIEEDHGDPTQDEGVCEDWAGYTPGGAGILEAKVLELGKAVVRVEGYFQNEKYFEFVEDELRDCFQLEPVSFQLSEGLTPVGIQVRRGDYVGSEKFAVCTAQYYLDAMKLVETYVSDPCFFVTTDDIAWCKSFFSRDPRVVISSNQSQVEGLALLASCRACIISNSTFGWWGAWLSRSNLVIAPDPWLGNAEWDCVPSRWIKMPARGITL